MNFNKPISLLFLLTLQTGWGFASVADSLGIKSEAGGIYVMHQVEKQETLYALSKRYGTTVAAIVENNQLSGSELPLGAVLKIPWGLGVIHIIQPGETLYALSKKYQTTVAHIKTSNSLSSNELEVGKELIILEPQAPAHDAPVPDLSLAATADSSNIGTAPTSASPVKEHGMAAVIDGNSDTRKYLALHSSAPVGTIMRVRNEMTNLTVFVRVVGKLPATGANNNVLIRVSPAAQEALGALDGKFRVELSYVGAP